MNKVPLLHDEIIDGVDNEDIQSRITIYKQLEKLPQDFYERIQYFQPQTGCFNQCAFCSQVSGHDIWQFSKKGLRNLIAALSTMIKDKQISMGGARSHRPSVLFPYLDNDIASYPYLEDYIKYTYRDLGVKTRISTVGYSSLNKHLQVMHENIVGQYSDAFAGMRFSFTPFTIGWLREKNLNFGTTRKRFIQDFGNALKTYLPLINYVSPSKEMACVELRFKPLINTYNEQLIEENIEGHNLICIGPHLLISVNKLNGYLPNAQLLSLNEDKSYNLNNTGEQYYWITSDTEIKDGNWREFALNTINDIERVQGTEKLFIRQVSLYRFENQDGYYYAVSPWFQPDGSFYALHIYPKTKTRNVSAYNDATRFLLNAILSYKYSKGINRREQFHNATWVDVENVLAMLYKQINVLINIDSRSAKHVEYEIIPLVEDYISALKFSGLGPEYFFHPGFTIDTGQIVNQGRSKKLFMGITSVENDPVTPNEERGYGNVSFSSVRGYIWRIAPVPVKNNIDMPNPVIHGGKNNLLLQKMAVQIQELDPRHLYPVNKSTGELLREYVIEGVDIEHVTLHDGKNKRAYPGIEI